MGQRYTNKNNLNIYFEFFIVNIPMNVGKGAPFVAKKTSTSFKMYTFTTQITIKK